MPSIKNTIRLPSLKDAVGEEIYLATRNGFGAESESYQAEYFVTRMIGSDKTRLRATFSAMHDIPAIPYPSTSFQRYDSLQSSHLSSSSSARGTSRDLGRELQAAIGLSQLGQSSTSPYRLYRHSSDVDIPIKAPSTSSNDSTSLLQPKQERSVSPSNIGSEPELLDSSTSAGSPECSSNIIAHDERKFFCRHENCKKRFTRKYDRDRHARRHTGERPYKCEGCSLSFSRTDALQRHHAAVLKGRVPKCLLYTGA